MYNVGGNIVSKTEYAYTTGTVGTAIKTYTYTYGNAWKDQLTAFDGTAIAYDASGNPTSYLGKTLTWSRGRLLTKYVSGSKTVDMQYDGKGIRVAKTRKIGTSVTTNSTYIYDNGGKLRTEIEGNTTRNYIYGQDGVVGYEENGEHFMYRKNFFGDITAIYKSTQKVAEYVYDAWGNCTITYETNGYGSRNPFRYRGYYFDSDLGMYYLTTRYYDPKTGRFINADTIEYLKPDAINGLNLYAYCKNNPLRYVDPTGHEELTQDEITDILCGAAIILWALVLVIYRISSSESIELNTSNIGEGNYFNLDLDWDWITPDPSIEPRLITEGSAFINCPVSICQAKLYFDAKKMHSLYANLLSVSVFAGFDIDENMYGFFVDVGVVNLGYDGRYIDIGVSGAGAGLGLGWQDGELVAKYDPVGYWGVDASIDLAQMVKDLFRQ